MEKILDRVVSIQFNYYWIVTLIANLMLLSVLLFVLYWNHTYKISGRTTIFQDINWIIMIMGYVNMMLTIFSYLIFKKYFRSSVIALSFFIIAYIINLAIDLIFNRTTLDFLF